MVEEAYGILRQFGDVYQCFRIGMAIDKRIDSDKIQVIFRHDIKTLVHNKI
jgi:hypothetical protein